MNPTRWLASVVCLVAASASLAPALVSAPEPGSEAARIVEVLRLAAGMVAADVGAGEGKFTSTLARGVGPEGRVYATEIAQDKLDELKQRMAADGIENVLTVLGDQQQTGLPRGCCDRVLLRLVYHHFAEPPAMQRSLWAALRPGGLIAVIDVPPKKGWPVVAGAPDRGGHGIEVAELVADMRRAGFEVVAQHDDWPAETDSYCVVFRRPADR
ncbi:MAG: class I SAM-dependent methyltransferase [Burkholderiales bacterium]